MTQGLPVIYSKGQGFDRQFEEGTVGFHVESRNAEEIANRIEDIMINYKTISENCVRLSDRFNWSEIAREYQRLYEDCVRTHFPPSQLTQPRGI
jgi:glycosyltransferase involved in cell wall biosynthesis